MLFEKLKKFIIGEALPNWEYKHQRLSKKIALAVFSSDALSSVAYATEEILLVLITAGIFALSYSLPIAMIIVFLLLILIISYRQTITAYPNGGGAYIVAKENLGEKPGLIAASSLLMDYILTVAVSVAAGVAALTSAFPELLNYKIIIGLLVIFFIMLMNLKGIKESGIVFAIPTYMFLFSFLVMIFIGFIRYFTGNIESLQHTELAFSSSVSLFLLMRAFSSGCAALTGVEAISNGVPAFKKPESNNAKTTLTIMAFFISFLFLSITFLSFKYNIVPQHDKTVVSILAENIFGRNIFFYIIQGFTMLILFLAANTAYADFPRLCYFLAKDRYMPNQFKHLGDRLVFSTGIIFLSFSASLLIILFKGSVHLLIPLYAVGVFTSFTLSQLGMVFKNIREKKEKWKRKAFVNGLGSLMTFIALIIIAITKFFYGAWIIIVLLPIIIFIFIKIKEHYIELSKELSLDNVKPPLKFKKQKHKMIVLINSLNKASIRALEFAKNFCNDVEALHINMSGSEAKKLKEKWEKFNPDVNLIMIDSPYRRMIKPLLNYLDEIEKKDRNLNVTIVIPEFVPKRWWQFLLHNQTGLSLKTAIFFRKRTSYISVQYFLKK
ncbi:MAG: APC family permease [Candidatus Woesearchaeota archaeon]